MSTPNQVVYSYNCFIDSSKSTNPNSTGINFEINTANMLNLPRDCSYFRLSLVEFTQTKAWYSINQLNGVMKVIITTDLPAATFEHFISLDYGEYPNIRTIAENLCKQLNNLFASQPMGLTNTTPNFEVDLTTSSIDQTQLNDMKLSIKSVSGIDPKIIAFGFDFSKNISDNWLSTYKILGGRVNLQGSANYTPGLNVVITGTGPSNKSMSITGFYKMCTESIDHVYLRTNLCNDSLSNVHDSDLTSKLKNLGGSDILAKIPCGRDYCTFDDSGNNQYFLNVPYRAITNLQFYITDRAGNMLPAIDSAQSLLGTLNCTMVIRIDIIKNII